MAYTKQSSVSGEKLPGWKWQENPRLECIFDQTRKGAGKGSDFTFHEVTEYTTGERYSLLGNTVLDGIFSLLKKGDRVKIEFKGEVTGNSGRKYKSYDWYRWDGDDLPSIENI